MDMDSAVVDAVRRSQSWNDSAAAEVEVTAVGSSSLSASWCSSVLLGLRHRLRGGSFPVPKRNANAYMPRKCIFTIIPIEADVHVLQFPDWYVEPRDHAARVQKDSKEAAAAAVRASLAWQA